MEKKAETNKSGALHKPRIMRGVVVSDKMKDTVVVSVDRFVQHPKYQKYFKVTKRFKADDKGNVHKMGETVTIEETKPISKDKRFRVIT